MIMGLDCQQSHIWQVVLEPFRCPQAVATPVIDGSVKIKIMAQARQFPEQLIFAKHPSQVSHHVADKHRVPRAVAFAKVRQDQVVCFFEA